VALDDKAGTHKSPRLSIVLATWQAAPTLDACLRSTIEQSFENWELLVADGASTDGTVDIIRRFEGHITWWNSEKDDGIYDAWNKTLAHARGEYVCFIGADDKWADADSLTRLFDAIGDDEYDLVTSQGNFYNSETGKSFTLGSAWDYKRFGPRMIICHPGLIHHRSLFERYGLFDASYSITGDLDFLLRLPENMRTLHVESITLVIGMDGVSRQYVGKRLKEQRQALSRCGRYGPVRAYINWVGKWVRIPIARLLGYSN